MSYYSQNAALVNRTGNINSLGFFEGNHTTTLQTWANSIFVNRSGDTMTGFLQTPLLKRNQADYRNYQYSLAKELNLTWLNGRRQNFTFSSGFSYPHSLLLVDDKLFIGFNQYSSPPTANGKLVRINDSNDLSIYDSITFTGDGVWQMIHTTKNNKIYVVHASSAEVLVTQVDPNTLAKSIVINDSADSTGTIPSITTDETSLYVVTSNSPTKLIKYSLSDFSRTSSVTLTGLNSGHSAIYDGSSIFVGGASQPAWLAKVNPTTLSYSSVTLPSGYNTFTDDITEVGDYVYAPLEYPVGNITTNENEGVLVRIKKDDLTYTWIHTGASTGSYGNYFDGEYIWNLEQNSKLSRLDLVSQQSDLIHLEPGETPSNEIVSDGSRLFLTTFSSKPTVIRIGIPTTTQYRDFTDFYTSKHAYFGGSVSITGKQYLSALNLHTPADDEDLGPAAPSIRWFSDVLSISNPVADITTDSLGNILFGTTGNTNLSLKTQNTTRILINYNGDTTISSKIISSNLAGTYGSGSAFVCVYDNGTLFASDAACP